MAGDTLTMDETLDLNFPACLAADFPREVSVAESAVARVLAAVRNVSFDRLVERSPGLKDNDWSNYLRCSLSPMSHAANALHRLGIPNGRVLDYGAYFGNFSLMFAELGYAVDAVDSYEMYGAALQPIVDLLPGAGVQVLDFANVGRDLAGLSESRYDVVLCMGVVEHIPHTPRPLLEALDRVLKPGGVLLLETPNVAHLYNRQKLARGEPIMTPLDIQYYATLPFEGHHREYTASEAVWMVQQLRHNILLTDLYNYSGYGQGILTGRDVANHWRMVADATLRELILVVSRKSVADVPFVPVTDWSSTVEDVEHYWRRRAPATACHEDGDAMVAAEQLLVDLQQAVVTRDRMLGELQAERTTEVARRDREIAALNARIGEVQRAFEATLGQRVHRLWRRGTGRQE